MHHTLQPKGLEMALSATFDKTRKDIEKTLSNSTPLLAVVGAGDLAVEKLRTVGGGLNARAQKIDTSAARDQAKAKFDDVQARVGAVPGEVRAAPEQLKSLSDKTQALLGDYLAAAISTYGDLAGRGKELVTRVRTQQATEDFEQQLKSTVTKAKATTTTAKKSAAKTKTAAKSATTTAKKQASATSTSAEATTTSAKKTAEAAADAITDAASKVGDSDDNAAD
jgi:hypothetical protein